MIIDVKSGDFQNVHIAPGTYSGVMTGVKPGKIKGITFADGSAPTVDENGMQDVIWWTFQVATKSGPVDVDGMTTYATGQKSKLRRWAMALGVAIAPGNFDVSALCGRGCLVVVEDRQKAGQEPRSGVRDVIAAPDQGVI